MKIIYLFLGFAFLSLTNVILTKEKNITIKLLKPLKEIIAGDRIVLQFTSNLDSLPSLYCSTGYGSTLINPIINENGFSFILPHFMTKKSGTISWKIIASEEVLLDGFLNILPQYNVSGIETYLGPPSIEAGGKDFAMQVVIPYDDFDNPLKDSTIVKLKTQFLNISFLEEIYVDNYISYKNIYSKEHTGRIFSSTEVLGINSKEYTINVLAAIPINFSISENRNHKYADGNQITTFYTSIITDAHGNVVNDGTFVSFFIITSEGAILKTYGTTINGIAVAKMLHPDYETQWSIKAQIAGMGESNTLKLKYERSINDFKVNYSEATKSFTVGPLNSFMNQTIPDGLNVALDIINQDRVVQTIHKKSKAGFVVFELTAANLKAGTYTFNVSTAGILKKIKKEYEVK